MLLPDRARSLVGVCLCTVFDLNKSNLMDNFMPFWFKMAGLFVVHQIEVESTSVAAYV